MITSFIIITMLFVGGAVDFLAKTNIKNQCDKQGYFMYTDAQGNKEKRVCGKE